MTLVTNLLSRPCMFSKMQFEELYHFRKLLTVQTIKENTYARFKFYGRNNLGEKLGDCCEEIWHVSRKENVS